MIMPYTISAGFADKRTVHLLVLNTSFIHNYSTIKKQMEETCMQLRCRCTDNISRNKLKNVEENTRPRN